MPSDGPADSSTHSIHCVVPASWIDANWVIPKYLWFLACNILTKAWGESRFAEAASCTGVLMDLHGRPPISSCPGLLPPKTLVCLRVMQQISDVRRIAWNHALRPIPKPIQRPALSSSSLCVRPET